MSERTSHIGTSRQTSKLAGRVVGAIVCYFFLCCLGIEGFANSDRSDAADAAQALVSSPQPVALSKVIHQNTPGNSQGSGLGLSWDIDASSTPTTSAPAGWSGVTAWGVVYQAAGSPVSPNNASDTVQIQGFQTYVLLTNGTWTKVQDQATSGVGGANYIADFSSDANIPFSIEQKNSDGSVTFNAPPSGYNDHFWPGLRGTFTPGTVAGVYVVAQMKTDDPQANLVAQLGADWWKNASALWAGDNVNNIAVGLNNWTKLTTQWQTLYYTSLDPQQFQANPPPHLLGDLPLLR